MPSGHRYLTTQVHTRELDKENWVEMSVYTGSSHYCSAVTTQLIAMRMEVPSLASINGLRILHCRELWCRSQMQHGSGVAVAVVRAGICSSDPTPGPETSICHRYGPKKKKKNYIG